MKLFNWCVLVLAGFAGIAAVIVYGLVMAWTLNPAFAVLMIVATAAAHVAFSRAENYC